MSGGVTQLVNSGPLLLAMPVAAAAGAVTFASPCVLPLVPGYLSFVTGMSGTDAQRAAGASAARPGRGRTVVGAVLFVFGFTVVFTLVGGAFGGLGLVLQAQTSVVDKVLGALTIVLGLLFAGVFDRFAFTGRIMRPSVRPRAGLAGAPLLGAMFGLSWTPCIGPTLSVVLTLATTTGSVGRGGLLAFVYGLGLGVPFIVVALAFQRGVSALAFARRHARLIAAIGGGMLVAVGVLEVTGLWAGAIAWLQHTTLLNYQEPL